MELGLRIQGKERTVGNTGVEQGAGNSRFADRDLYRDVIGHFASPWSCEVSNHLV